MTSVPASDGAPLLASRGYQPGECCQAEARGRLIRGQASAEVTQALVDEGIGVLPLPIPKALKETLQ